MTRVVCLSVLCCSLYSLCLGAGRGDLPLLKIDTKSPTQDVSLIDIMESNLYVNDMISMCEENVGHRCVHFTECDEEGYWDPNLVTSDMFDVRYQSIKGIIPKKIFLEIFFVGLAIETIRMTFVPRKTKSAVKLDQESFPSGSNVILID